MSIHASVYNYLHMLTFVCKVFNEVQLLTGDIVNDIVLLPLRKIIRVGSIVPRDFTDSKTIVILVIYVAAYATEAVECTLRSVTERD